MTTDMQSVGKLTAADLSDVRADSRPNTHPRTITPGAILKLVVRSCAVIIALASIAAVSLVGLVSFGCDGAARLLGRVRTLRDAYQFLSRAYHRFLKRLAL